MTPKKLMLIAAWVAVVGIVLGLVAWQVGGPDEIQTIDGSELVKPGEESEARARTIVRTVPGRTIVVAQADDGQPEQPSEPDPDEPDDPAEPDLDLDDDGHPDDVDNCPTAANPDQADFDGDGLGDVCDPDDDNDNLSDAAESGYGTNPYDKDTDGDGWWDGNEVNAGTDPLDPNDYPVFEPCFGCL